MAEAKVVREFEEGDRVVYSTEFMKRRLGPHGVGFKRNIGTVTRLAEMTPASVFVRFGTGVVLVAEKFLSPAVE